jgi:hypothetical protein
MIFIACAAGLQVMGSGHDARDIAHRRTYAFATAYMFRAASNVMCADELFQFERGGTRAGPRVAGLL